MQFGLLLWPERLPVDAQNVFWLASGVNTAGLLILGLRWWPILLINAFPPWFCGFATFGMDLLGATSNALEALLAGWVILYLGKFQGRFDSLRAILALVTASLLAPWVNTVVVPTYMCLVGLYPWADYGKALGQWNFSNGAAMLIVTPLILKVLRPNWTLSHGLLERMVVAALTAGFCFAVFTAVWHGAGMNYTFLIFPVVIYTAVRFGLEETTVALGIVLVSIFASLALCAGIVPVTKAPGMIWFLQTFCWVLAATGLLMAALVAERHYAEVAKVEATLEAERAKLATLRYQMNPHFLFNALNSLRSSLPSTEPVARSIVTDLSFYLRSTLDGTEADCVTLREEVQNARNYLAIEQHRFGGRLRAVFHIDSAAEKRSVPVFLLQPLVENAVRHGLEASWKSFVITVSACVKNDHLQIEVANTGKWKTPGTHGGLGLENIRRRLRMLYGPRADLRICLDEELVRIQIEIPV